MTTITATKTPLQLLKESKLTVTTNWWGLMGKKTQDYSGDINGLLEKWGIKCSSIHHPNTPDIKGIRFVIPAGSSMIQFDAFSMNGPSYGAVEAVTLLLSYLGDKAAIRYLGRTKRINH